MTKKKVGKSVVATAITLSLVCTTGATALATESSQVQGVTSETSVTGVQQENSTTSQPEVSLESSRDEEVSQGGTSSPESSKQEEVSKGESSYTVYPEKDVDIDLNIAFDSSVLATSAFVKDNCINLSNVSFSVVSKAGKTVGTYNLTDKLLSNPFNASSFVGLKVKVPEWKEGSEYTIKFTNLPSFFSQKTTIKYLKTKEQDREVVLGVTVPVTANITSEANTIVVQTKNMVGILKGGVLVNLKAVDENNKEVYNKSVSSDKNGYAVFKLPDEATNLTISLGSTVSGEYGFTPITMPYDYLTANNVTVTTISSELTGKKYEEQLDDIKEPVKFGIKAEYKSSDNMDLFTTEKASATVTTEDGKTVMGMLDLSTEKSYDSLVLAKGKTYKVEINCSETYACSKQSFTVNLSKDTDQTITFTPQVFLEIYNEKSGVKNTANFTIPLEGGSKTYNDSTSKRFAVNGGSAFTIINNDNDEEITISIPASASVTRYNLATGSLGVVNTGADQNKVGDGSDTVPQTGDAMPYVIGSMILVTAGCFSGWVYYKKKGDKFNEKRKKDEQK